MRHAIDEADQAAWAMDLDGVVWLAGELIPGAGEAASAVRGEGQSILPSSALDLEPVGV